MVKSFDLDRGTTTRRRKARSEGNQYWGRAAQFVGIPLLMVWAGGFLMIVLLKTVRQPGMGSASSIHASFIIRDPSVWAFRCGCSTPHLAGERCGQGGQGGQGGHGGHGGHSGYSGSSRILGRGLAIAPSREIAHP